MANTPPYSTATFLAYRVFFFLPHLLDKQRSSCRKMARSRVRFAVAFCVLAPSFVGMAAARDPPFRVNIGYFKFPVSDPEMKARVERVENNITAWDDFYDATLDYWLANWNNTQPLPEDTEETALRRFANKTKVDVEDFGTILQQAKDGYATDLRAQNNDPQQLWEFDGTDLSEKVLDVTEEEFKFLHHERLAAYAGVGSPVDCSVHIDRMLDGMSEWEKAGMAAASTLMALLPTFLAFGNL